MAALTTAPLTWRHQNAERRSSDPDASWRHPSAVSTRKGRGFYCAVADVVEDGLGDVD